jgi:hypothetical protein
LTCYEAACVSDGSNAFDMRAEFEADRIRLWVRDRTGLYGEHMIMGRMDGGSQCLGQTPAVG